MKRLVAVLSILWSAAMLVVASWMVTGAFLAKTAQHEGLPAQASLLLGGLLIAAFSALLIRQSVRILAAPDEASGA